MDNIDCFNTITGLVFDELYRSFPIPVSLIRTDSIAKKMGVIPRQIAYMNSDCIQYDFLQGKIPGTDLVFGDIFVYSLEWLREEGFIRNRSKLAPDTELVLTTKALAALSAIPSSLDKSLGQQLKEAAKDTGSKAAGAAITDIVGQIIGAATKSYFG